MLNTRPQGAFTGESLLVVDDGAKRENGSLETCCICCLLLRLVVIVSNVTSKKALIIGSHFQFNVDASRVCVSENRYIRASALHFHFTDRADTRRFEDHFPSRNRRILVGDSLSTHPLCRLATPFLGFQTPPIRVHLIRPRWSLLRKTTRRVCG